MSDGKKELFTGKEWTKEETAGDLEGEFIEPFEGLVVTGKLIRAFATDGEFGISAAYAIRGEWNLSADGGSAEGVVLVGEKAFFRDSIRDLKLGTDVRLTFKAKESLLRKGKDGKEKDTGQKMWRGELLSKRNGDGKAVRAALADYYARTFRKPVAAPSPETFVDVPF